MAQRAPQSTPLPYPYTSVPAWRVAPDFVPTDLTRWLEDRCRERQMTVGDVAQRMQVQYRTVYGWFRWQKRPSTRHLGALARLFDVSSVEPYVIAATVAPPAERTIAPPPSRRGPRGALPPHVSARERDALMLDLFVRDLRRRHDAGQLGEEWYDLMAQYVGEAPTLPMLPAMITGAPPE